MANVSTAPDVRLFYSTAVEGDVARLLGAPHYSYHFAAARFCGLLARRGLTPTLLRMPEYYATGTPLPVDSPAAAVHLIFRSTEQFRLCKPAAANIGCFAWEFPVLKSDTMPEEHPFANQCAMLRLCDEIWTPSSFAAQTLRAHGVPNVYRIPAPIEPPGERMARATAQDTLAAVPAVTLDLNFSLNEAQQTRRTEATGLPLADWLGRESMAKPPILFLSVLNPEDDRKNLDALIRGFHMLRAALPQAILLIKALTSESRFSLAQVGGLVIRHKLASGTVLADPGIAVINAYLSDEEMSALYGMADFYLCTSLAEGQNLPLLEAMAHGTVAVSTANTAMADYIDPSCAYLVATSPRANDNPHLAGNVAGRPYQVALCGPRDVMRAMQVALAAPLAEREAKAAAGIAVVARQFGEATVWQAIAARLASHAAAMPARILA